MLIKPFKKGFSNTAAPYYKATSGAAPTTWNPADASANITLDATHLIVTANSSGFSQVRSVASASSGKKYWEITLTTKVGNAGVGVGNSTASLSTFNDANGVHYFSDGSIYRGGSGILTGGAYAQAAIVGIAFDIPNNLVWFTTNGTSWNGDILANQNPVGAVGGASTSTITGPFFAMAATNFSGDVWTTNFGGGAFNYSAPSGFGNW